MIQATFKQNDTDQIVSVEISGHAMSGEYGQDIVCAGVSAIAISMVNNLERQTKTQPIVEVDDVNGGYLYVELPDNLDDEAMTIAQIILSGCYYALADDIQENYSQYIKVLMN